MEKQAHRFAAAFLAPGDAMLAEIAGHQGRVTLTTLVDIKSRWGISVKALVGRMRDLHVINDDQARSLFKQVSARGWNRQEPVKVGTEEAQWMALAVKAALRRSPDAVKGTGLGQSHFDRWSNWSAVPADDLVAPVYSLDAHRSRTGAPASR